jgi:hypothetical protein
MFESAPSDGDLDRYMIIRNVLDSIFIVRVHGDQIRHSRDVVEHVEFFFHILAYSMYDVTTFIVCILLCITICKND